jgi:hypothetical protein
MKEERMTAEAFDALAPKMRRVTVGSMEVMRRILVGGESRDQVAASVGLTPQRVGAMVKQFRAAQSDIPASWVEVREWLPPELAAQVRKMAAEAKANVKAG